MAAAGVQADGGGQVTLSGGSTETPNTVTTTGAGAIGLYALSGGTIDVDGPTAVTTSGTTSTTATGGLVAYGVNANGLGSTVTFGAATTVTTNGSGAAGLDAYGLYANNGGTIDTTGTPSVTVTTYGTDANGVYASGTSTSTTPATPSTISISGASITTNGSTATGVLADLGGQVTVDGGSVTTNGGRQSRRDVVATGAMGSMVTIDGSERRAKSPSPPTAAGITDASIDRLQTATGVLADLGGQVKVTAARWTNGRLVDRRPGQRGQHRRRQF